MGIEKVDTLLVEFSNVIKLQHLKTISFCNLTEDIVLEPDKTTSDTGNIHYVLLKLNGHSVSFTDFIFSTTRLIELDTSADKANVLMFWKTGDRYFFSILDAYDWEFVSPVLSNLTIGNGYSSVLVSFDSDEAGTYYWAVFPENSGAKTYLEIKNGTGAIANGNSSMSSEQNSIVVYDLQTETTYDIHVVSKDVYSNISNILKDVIQTDENSLNIPTNDSLTRVSNTELQASVSRVSNNTTYLKLEKMLAHVGVWQTVSDTLPANTTTSNLTGLLPYVKYETRWTALGTPPILDSSPSQTKEAYTKRLENTLLSQTSKVYPRFATNSALALNNGSAGVPWSWVIWVRPTAYNASGYNFLVSRTDGVTTSSFLAEMTLNYSDTVITFRLWGASNANYATWNFDGQQPSLNEWTCYILTWTGGKISSSVKLYKNGVDAGSASSFSITGTFNYPVRRGYAMVGEYSGNVFPTFVNGQLTQAAEFNKELSQSEVTEIYSGGKIFNLKTCSASANLKVYHMFDGVLTDEVNSAYDCTQVGTVVYSQTNLPNMY